jgi:hypothetical protein
MAHPMKMLRMGLAKNTAAMHSPTAIAPAPSGPMSHASTHPRAIEIMCRLSAERQF